MSKHGFANTFKFIFFLTLLAAGISSCYRYPSYTNDPNVQNLTPGQINQIYAIEKSGIQVIKQGMQLTFIIPVDAYFVKTTGDIKTYRETDLDRLANFIRSYNQYFAHMNITVSGYTDTVLLKPARNKQARHYANAIADYLKEAGVPDDRMKVQSFGAEHPIGSNAYPMGASFNRRVVVELH